MTNKRRLVYEINTARHCMMKFLDAKSKNELGISVVQLTALMVLHEKKGCLMKDLAQALMLDKSAVTGLAKRMQGNDLIAKETCSEDSRVTRLEMTDKGRSLLSKGVSYLQEFNQLMTDGFSEEELDTVSRFLGHLTQVFSKES